jgi:hypothetical protein
MVIQRRSGLVVDEWTYLSRGANQDGIAPEDRRRGERITRMVNHYNQKNT